MMDIFEQLRSGADVDMATPEYVEAIKHMTDCANICLESTQRLLSLSRFVR